MVAHPTPGLPHGAVLWLRLGLVCPVPWGRSVSLAQLLASRRPLGVRQHRDVPESDWRTALSELREWAGHASRSVSAIDGIVRGAEFRVRGRHTRRGKCGSVRYPPLG